MLEAELFALLERTSGCAIRRNQAKASGGGMGHSGGDLLPALESIGSRICDISAVYFRERGKFVRLRSALAHDVLNGDAASLQSVSY
jgi:hypothetical protein